MFFQQEAQEELQSWEILSEYVWEKTFNYLNNIFQKTI